MSENEFKYPNWQRPLREAILELGRDEQLERLRKVEALIFGRFNAISSDMDRKQEREALASAVSVVRFLKKDVDASQSFLSTIQAAATDAGIVVSRKYAESESRLLAAIVNSSTDAVISKTLDGTITSWNESAQRLFGFSAEEVIGQDIRLIIPLDRLSEELMILESLKKGVRIDHFDTVRLRKDGALIDVSLTISPIKDALGHIVGASKVARDIAARKQTEATLRMNERYLRLQVDGLETQMNVATKELNVRTKEVVRQSDELRKLSHRLLQAQDEECRKLSRDLHDSAGQILTVLHLNLTRMREDGRQGTQIDQCLDDSEKLVQQLTDEIRTMSYLLHPPLLDENGLPQAIGWYRDGLVERSGVKIAVTVSDGFGRLPSDIELALFRVVQECLTNIHRHSASKTAKISLARRTNKVSLEIEDEGKGIAAEKLADVESRHSGVGITGMRERIRYLGGTMDIQSNDGGTKVSFIVPIPVLGLSATQSNIM